MLPESVRALALPPDVELGLLFVEDSSDDGTVPLLRKLAAEDPGIRYWSLERGFGHVRDHTIGSPHPDLPGTEPATDACTWCHTGGRGAPDDAPILEPAAIREAFYEWYPGAKPRPGWVEAIAAGREAEQPVKVFFHSHLDCGAYFSLPQDIIASYLSDGEIEIIAQAGQQRLQYASLLF